MDNIKDLREAIKTIRDNKDFKDITLKDNVYIYYRGRYKFIKLYPARYKRNN
jgi:hypothetical protein